MTFYVRIGDRPTTILFTVVNKVAVDLLLRTTSLDEHILAILPDEQKVTVCHWRPAAIMKQKNQPANAVLNTEDTGKVRKKTFYKTSKDTNKEEIQSTIVQVAKQLVLELLPVTPVMVTTKPQRLQHCDPSYKLSPKSV